LLITISIQNQNRLVAFVNIQYLPHHVPLHCIGGEWKGPCDDDNAGLVTAAKEVNQTVMIIVSHIKNPEIINGRSKIVPLHRGWVCAQDPTSAILFRVYAAPLARGKVFPLLRPVHNQSQLIARTIMLNFWKCPAG
jgi:hypothetical protein